MIVRSRPRISVVIVSYNTADLLRACLASLVTQPERLEVIVVDNASTDDSARVVSQEFPDAILIRNRQNVGFGAANNQGFARSTAEYILMLNSDCEIPVPDHGGGALEALVRTLETQPDVGVVAPRLENGDGTVQQSANWSEPTLLTELLEYTLLNRVLYRLLPSTRYPGKRLLSQVELKQPHDVADLLGACLLFRRSLLEKVGPFDERFFLFLEETDFNRRVRQAGLSLRYQPETTVIHHWGGSIDAAGTLRKRFALYFPSLYTYWRKHHSIIYAAAGYLIALIGSAAIYIVAWVLVVPGLVSKRAGRLARSLRAIYGSTLRWHLGLGRTARKKA